MIKYHIHSDTYTLITVETNTIKATFSSYGASLYRLECFDHDFFLSPDDIECFYHSKGYYGKTLGPIAGRYVDKANKIILHGGENGLSFMNFDYEIKQSQNGIKIIFKKTLKNKDEYKGSNANYQISYILSDDTSELLILHEVTAFEDTNIGLSLHSYFRLKEENVLNASLELKANKVSIVDDSYLIRGYTSIKEGYDFSSLRNVKDELGSTSQILLKGHHFKNVEYPIIIKDETYSVKIESDYPDALITIDQLPLKEICFNKAESKYNAFVIEPEYNPHQLSNAFISKNNTRLNYIKYIFSKN